MRNPKAEQKFARNSAFKVEFKFEPGERILFLAYQNVKYAILKFLIPMGLIFGILIGFFYYIFSDINSILTTIMVGLLVFCLVVILVIQTISATSYRYLVTNKRIVVGYTFLQRWARTVNFTNIVDMVVTQGPIGRLFKVGTIQIITGSNEGGVNSAAGGNAKTVLLTRGFLNVKNPFRIKNMIHKIQKYYETSALARPQLTVPEHPNPDLLYQKYYNFDEEEKIYKVYKRKSISSFCSLITGLFVILGYGAQFIADLFETIDWNAMRPFLIALGIIVGAIIIFIIIISKYHAKGFEFTVTDRRIIIFKKFLTIRCRDVIMGKITEVSIFQMATGRAANFGMIRIATKGFENVSKFQDLISIQGVPDVPSEKDDIMNIVLHYQDGKLFSPLDEYYDPEYYSK